MLALLAITACLLQAPPLALAAEEQKPERLITMAVEYPGLEIAAGDDISMNLTFHNKGRSGETVDVWVADTPDGWDTAIKTYKYTVTGVHVPAGESKSITFEAKPGEAVQPGQYAFRLAAQTRDAQFKLAETVEVTVTPKQEEAPKASKDITLTTTYPVLRGPRYASPGWTPPGLRCASNVSSGTYRRMSAFTVI
jgi:uncharacterized membrane protein